MFFNLYIKLLFWEPENMDCSNVNNEINIVLAMSLNYVIKLHVCH